MFSVVNGSAQKVASYRRIMEKPREIIYEKDDDDTPGSGPVQQAQKLVPYDVEKQNSAVDEFNKKAALINKLNPTAA